MKILHITSDYLYNIGGIFQHIENLTEFLSVKNEIVIIYLNKISEDKTVIDEHGRKVYYISHKGSQLKRFLNYPMKKIEEIIFQELPELIHVHTLFEAFKLNKISNIPMIFTNHSSSYLKMHNKFILREFILPKIFKKFFLIISPSTELFEKTNHSNKLMISNGVNTNRFNLNNRSKLDKNLFLKDLGIDFKNQTIVLSTRRLFDKNGILDFIQSNINYFSKTKDKVIYLVVGDGEHYESIKKIIQDNNLFNVVLLGKKENKEIDSFYYISDFCAIPSKMEAISISALEAMACGCVVIANEVGGLKELIDNEQTGIFLVNLSLEKALNIDDMDYSTIQNNAYNMVKEKYSWEKIAIQTEKEYEKILQKN